MYPRKIIVLASSPLQQNGEFANFYNGEYLGGQIRMDAAVHIAQENPDTEFILVGGYNAPSEGDIDTSNKVNDMAAFLKRNAPDVHLQLVYSLPCTHHNFVAVFNSPEIDLRDQELGILTNAYHLPRALVFALQAAEATDTVGLFQFVPISAEEVLNRSIESIVGNKADQYESRMQSEVQGLLQLRSGTYTDSCTCLAENGKQLHRAITLHGDKLLTMRELADIRSFN